MIENRLSTEATQQYALAYEAQYKTKRIQKAFALYEQIIATHPDSQEAEYSRSQIRNIVNAVVPKKTVMDSLMELGHFHFNQDLPLDVEPGPA